MTGVLLSMVAGSCFLIAGLKHHERGEHADARKCAVMVVISLVLLGVSIAVEVA